MKAAVFHQVWLELSHRPQSHCKLFWWNRRAGNTQNYFRELSPWAAASLYDCTESDGARSVHALWGHRSDCVAWRPWCEICQQADHVSSGFVSMLGDFCLGSSQLEAFILNSPVALGAFLFSCSFWFIFFFFVPPSSEALSALLGFGVWCKELVRVRVELSFFCSPGWTSPQKWSRGSWIAAQVTWPCNMFCVTEPKPESQVVRVFGSLAWNREHLTFSETLCCRVQPINSTHYRIWM